MIRLTVRRAGASLMSKRTMLHTCSPAARCHRRDATTKRLSLGLQYKRDPLNYKSCQLFHERLFFSCMYAVNHAP